MTRDFIYHELKDNLEQDLCPICTLINKNIDRFIEGLLYESVNDVEIRKDIKKSKGYCNYHGWKIESFGDPLAHSIIYGDLMESLGDSIENFLKDINSINYEKKLFSNKTKENNKLEKFRKNLNTKDNCPICKMVFDSEKLYILSFAEYIREDNEFKAQFEESGFLCIPHIIKLLEFYSDINTMKKIMEVQLSKIKKLSHHLSEIKRKSDYRFSNEDSSSEEKTAWIKAIKQWVGEPGIRK